MKKAKWVVESKFTTRKELEEFLRKEGRNPENVGVEDFNDIEISVIREDNKQGQISYGWEGDDKIILFSYPDHSPTQKDMDRYQKIAEVICNALNHEGL